MTSTVSPTTSPASRSTVWVPVALVTLYYATPAVMHLNDGIALLIVVPGLIACAAVLARHTHPRAAAAVTIACLVFSPAALGGVVGVLASRARRVRRPGELPELAGWTVLAVVAKVVELALPWYAGTWTPTSTVELTISASLLGFAVLAGLLARASASSAASARDAEEARAAEIRLAERARIAREMHDVVAHRISLVAMTAGALAYRDDLPADAHEAASVIRTNSRLALDELRAVLADLRDEAPGTAREGTAGAPSHAAQAPQPGLAELPILVAEAREVTDVTYSCDLAPTDVSAATGRHLYRIVQEGLTNARKHAPGHPVSVHIGREGGEIVARIRNPLDDAAAETSAGAGRGPGYGLVGIEERARLVGGSSRVEVVDGRFVVTVRVPAGSTPGSTAGSVA